LQRIDRPHRDLLLRHQATHAKNAADGEIGSNRTVERATKACNACVVSKVKCDNSRPCRRCQKKNFVCTTKTTTRTDASAFFDVRDQSTTAAASPCEQNVAQVVPRRGQCSDLTVGGNSFSEEVPIAQELLNLYHETSTHQNHATPSFFDQIMVPEPDFLEFGYSQPPLDFIKWMPEVDWFDNVDIFGSDFAPAIDETFQTPNLESHGMSTSQVPQAASKEATSGNNSGESVKRRHAIFKEAQWLWQPEHNQRAFSDHEGITLDERQVDLASSPHHPYSSDVTIPDHLSQSSRDRIFQLVSKTARSQISIPSFPSADCLDKLIKVGIAKKTETDAWIHPYTFESENLRPEFLTALVAAGCICFGIPSVNRTGLVLQEIVRVSLSVLSEQDNSATRELQYLQASMLWLDIGAFCGFRRKMEIAESSLQGLVTALRRTGRFDHVRYPVIIPIAEDNEDELDKKWRQWVELESYKRLVYHLLEHDIDMTIVNQRQPLISYAELTLPLPAPKSLWLASSAEVWRVRMLIANSTDSRPSLRSILQDEGASLDLHPGIDTQIARSAYLHGLAAQIWEHSQQSILLLDLSDPSSQLWSRSRQQKLYQHLVNAKTSFHNAKAITCVFHQFSQMSLFVNLETIIHFAGKCGEEAAHRAYIALQPWSLSKDARTAVSKYLRNLRNRPLIDPNSGHAGQVLHAARAIPPYQNRGQDSFMIHHAIMVLWTYSMLISDRAKRTGTNTPSAPDSNAENVATPVFLDDARSSNQNAIDAFILLNNGTPCLHISMQPEEICQIKYPSQVMRTGVKLLEGTHPDVDREIGPPLLRALCGLMEELGGLR
jgi:hypothetical protein